MLGKWRRSEKRSSVNYREKLLQQNCILTSWGPWIIFRKFFLSRQNALWNRHNFLKNPYKNYKTPYKTSPKAHIQSKRALIHPNPSHTQPKLLEICLIGALIHMCFTRTNTHIVHLYRYKDVQKQQRTFNERGGKITQICCVYLRLPSFVQSL